ncbi:MAG: hypothetical protein ACFFAB_09920 [Candidatus Heimdallarchaeota archaeon]
MPNNNKAIQLRIYDTGIINELLSKGLKSGNKVKNQVKVPLWIKKIIFLLYVA